MQKIDIQDSSEMSSCEDLIERTIGFLCNWKGGNSLTGDQEESNVITVGGKIHILLPFISFCSLKSKRKKKFFVNKIIK